VLNFAYTYSASRSRLKKINNLAVPVATEWFMPDGSDVVTDYTQSGSGSLTLQTSYVQSRAVDSKLARITGGTNAEHYYVPDALGSVTHLIDSSQNIVNSEATDAWGNVIASSLRVSGMTMA